jgi:two-component system, LytTR family, response regulator AlgR
VKVLIVDDEGPARERLRQIIDDLDGYEFAGEAGDGEQAISIVSEARPDIVLLDIRMPGISGLDTAHHLNTLAHPPAVVFTTAYDEYAVEAFEARAVGYVLKPVRSGRLEAALEHASRLASTTLSEIAAQSGISSRRQHVCARVHDRLTLIPLQNIAYFQADQKYVAVHHDDGQCLIDESLKLLETEFADAFVRVHRGALVAVNRIATLDKTGDGKTRVVLRGHSHDDDKQLIISRRHVAEVRRRLKGG